MGTIYLVRDDLICKTGSFINKLVYLALLNYFGYNLRIARNLYVPKNMVYVNVKDICAKKGYFWIYEYSQMDIFFKFKEIIGNMLLVSKLLKKIKVVAITTEASHYILSRVTKLDLCIIMLQLNVKYIYPVIIIINLT
jgi:hypothetical protein